MIWWKKIRLEIRLKQNIKIDTKLLPQARNWTVKTLGNKIIMELKREEYQEIFIKTLNLILTIIILKKIESEESIKKFLSILMIIKNFLKKNICQDHLS